LEDNGKNRSLRSHTVPKKLLEHFAYDDSVTLSKRLWRYQKGRPPLGRVAPKLLFLNPPYDHEISESRNARMERLFLEHAYRWSKSAGVLVLVIPGNRLSECVDILAVHFREKAIYRLSAPEAVRYNQIVLFGVRRTRREREQLKDWDVQRAKAKLMGFARKYDELPVLPDQADRQFAVPPSGPAQLIHRGLPLDTLEDLLPTSVAYRQAGRILFAPEIRATGRPLTPLHGGHVGLDKEHCRILLQISQEAATF
jgi:hypothetical protein